MVFRDESGDSARPRRRVVAAAVAVCALLMLALSAVGPGAALASSHHGRVTPPEFRSEKGLIEGHQLQVEGFADTLATQQSECTQYQQLGENVKEAFRKIVLTEQKTFLEDEKTLLRAEKKWAEGLDSRAQAYKTADDKKLVTNAGHDLVLSIAHSEDALHEEMVQALEFSFFSCEEVEQLHKAEADDDLAHGKFSSGAASLAAAVKSEP